MKIAGVDIGGTKIKYCLYDTDKPFGTDIVKTAPTHADRGGRYVINNILDILAGLGSFDRIGICSTGQIDVDTGKVIYACDNVPDYTGILLSDAFKERFGVPVAVENDVNAAMLAEALFGAGKPDEFIIGVAYGTGIGGAIVCNGKLFHGSSCSAGEFGHTMVHAGGIECTCGNRGCYEAYASTGALCRMALKRFGKPLSGRDITARRGDPEYDALIAEWIEEVVYGLVSIVHIFNPDNLILGGGIMEDKIILDSVKERLLSSVIVSYRNVAVNAAVFGNAAGLRGAIHLARTMEP